MEKLHIAIVDKTGNDAKESGKISLASLQHLPTTVQRKVPWWVRCDLEKKPLWVSRNFTHLKIHVNFIRKLHSPVLKQLLYVQKEWQGLSSYILMFYISSVPSKEKDVWKMIKNRWKGNMLELNTNSINLCLVRDGKYFPFSICGCGPTDERCQVVLKSQSNHPWFYQLICKKEILVTE